MSLYKPRRTPDDEQRLIVLCTLKAIGPCTELQMLQFISEHDLMNYFDMMFALGDLCAGGQAVRTQNKTGYLYEVTEAGKEALGLFGNRVPRSIQSLLEETGPLWRQKFQSESQCTHEITQTESGEIDLTLTLSEHEMDMLKMTLCLPSRELAGKLSAKWPKKAGEIYETIMRILSEDDS